MNGVVQSIYSLGVRGRFGCPAVALHSQQKARERGPGHQLWGRGSAAARPARQVDAWQGEQRACASSLDRVQNSADSTKFFAGTLQGRGKSLGSDQIRTVRRSSNLANSRKREDQEGAGLQELRVGGVWMSRRRRRPVRLGGGKTGIRREMRGAVGGWPWTLRDGMAVLHDRFATLGGRINQIAANLVSMHWRGKRRSQRHNNNQGI